MAFSTGTTEIQEVGSGEVSTNNPFVITDHATYETGLLQGRFCKADSGSIDKLDGSATPYVAGIVKRNPSSAIEDGSTITTDNMPVAEVCSFGFITVDPKGGEAAPAWGAAIFAENTNDANAGMALSVQGGNGVATNAKFVRVVGSVWLVALNCI